MASLHGDGLWHSYDATIETNAAAQLRIGAVWEAGVGANDTCYIDDLSLETLAVVATAAFGVSSDDTYNPTLVGTVVGVIGVVKGAGGNAYVHYFDVATAGSLNSKGVRIYYKNPLVTKGTPVVVDVLIDKAGRGQLKGIKLVEPLKVP